MIPEVPQTWFYIYHDAQGKFIKEVSLQRQFPLESVTVMPEGIYIDNWFET